MASYTPGTGGPLEGEHSQSPPMHAMNALRAIRQYFDKMLKPKDKAKEITGMKSMLLDKETKNIVGMVYAMHELLEKEVYHVGNLDAEKEASQHLKVRTSYICVYVFVFTAGRGYVYRQSSLFGPSKRTCAC